MSTLVDTATYATPVTFSTTATWIWDDGAPSPRNAWRWFRRTFDLTDPTPDATIQITADTRYRLWVNGTAVGHGPVRGYTHHWFVDTWEIGHLLRTDRPNVIAVHVLHFGVATFTTFRQRGGLLAEIDWGEATGNASIGTDASWKVLTPPIHEPRSSRISCQLGFTEQIDARAFDSDIPWTDPAFDDAYWPNATIFAAAGDGPWGPLYPRDIPPLEESSVRPASVAQMAFVHPPVFSVGIDMRTQMSPEAVNHANHVGYTGYLATIIRLAKTTTVTVLLPQRKPALGINGVWSAWDELDEAEQGARSRTVSLPAGDHLLVADISFVDHGHTVHLVVNADDPDALTLVSPIGDEAETPFVTIGPVTPLTVGTIEESWPQPEPIPTEIAARVRSLTDAQALISLGDLVRPVPAALVSPASLLANAVHPRERRLVPVPADLRAIPAGNAAVMPAKPGYDTEVVFDLGREFSGFIAFDVDAPAGVTVDVYGFEYLDGLSGHREDSVGMENAFRYVTRNGRQTYRSPSRRGMRYLQLTVRRPADSSPDVPVILHDLHVVESHFPVSRVGSFRCSDARLDAIWEMSRRTVIACMEDTYVDCPGYEQVFWVGDSYSSARFAAYLFGAEALTRRCLRLVPQSAPQSPLYGSNIPSAWDSVIPNFTFFWTMAVDEHCFRTGDQAFAEELWPQVQSALTAFSTHTNPDGLFEITAWNLLDWAPIDQPNSGVVAHQNCLLVMALEAAGRIAALAGSDAAEEAIALLDLAARLRKAIDTHLWSDEAEAFIDAIHSDGTRSATISVHTQMFALLAGVPNGERGEHLERMLLDPPAEWVQIGSPWMSIFLYDALADRGQTATALADARRNYGFMLDRDATTCWEMFPSSNFLAGRGVLSRSHCHAWSAAPAAFFPARLLGIRPLAPGWSRVLVAPEPCTLTWAEGSAPHPEAGSIDVRWTLDDAGAMDLRIQVPRGVEVETRLPEGIKGSVSITEVG